MSPIVSSYLARDLCERNRRNAQQDGELSAGNAGSSALILRWRGKRPWCGSRHMSSATRLPRTYVDLCLSVGLQSPQSPYQQNDIHAMNVDHDRHVKALNSAVWRSTKLLVPCRNFWKNWRLGQELGVKGVSSCYSQCGTRQLLIHIELKEHPKT